MTNVQAIDIEGIRQILQKRGFRVEKLKDGVRCFPDHQELPNIVLDLYITHPEVDSQELFKTLSVGASEKKTALLGCLFDTYACYARITAADKTDETRTYHKGVKTVMEDLKGVDSGMFRQTMDQIGLPRSGNLRLALTRIFRASMDADELMATISEEADRMVSPGDQNIVRDLRKTGQVTFITNILHLLWEKIVLKHIKAPDKFL